MNLKESRKLYERVCRDREKGKIVEFHYNLKV